MLTKNPREAGTLPIEGCWVETIGPEPKLGIVRSKDGATGLRVFFPQDTTERVLTPGEWNNGLKPGFVVQDVPVSAARKSLGLGTIVSNRELAGRQQCLVHLHASGDLRWIPFEHLRRVMEPKLQYFRQQQATEDAAERTTINIMAHALRTWNESTGALGRLDIDPLPHQISLVHRILNSGHANWLVADDVGLGKTIEVGMLLNALERKQSLRRVLIIVPSGLTRQWKDEMLLKFDRDFSIYGRDFNIERPREWGQYDRVITSLDLVKPRGHEDDGSNFETRFGKLLGAQKWDLVIFDEAHRLSRDEGGRTILRYKLADELRQRTDNLLLLTGTPHQGNAAKFQNLLRLVRPELEDLIATLDVNPDIVGEIVLRNRKIDAVDANGQFIFHGLHVRRVEIPSSAAATELDRRLVAYLRRGYTAGDQLGGKQGRAIGFVMTIYRKLASSSVYALALAMARRRARLLGQKLALGQAYDLDSFEASTDGDPTEGEDNLADIETPEAKPFFNDEITLIDDIIGLARACFSNDEKSIALVQIVKDLVVKDQQRLLVFTEYRATQTFLTKVVSDKTGIFPVLIHGGQTVDQKRQAVEDFENKPTVLISTEAGGEGLNLHRQCHVVVNYDLPWNPARLTQRIGRLYRYGQDKKVVVLNLHSKDTIDNQILATALDRIQIIVSHMAKVGNQEFDSNYAAEVMGDLLERLDIADILEEARNGRVERSNERIDQALKAANQARSMQEEVLSYADRLDPQAWEKLGSFSAKDVAVFIQRSCRLLGVAYEALDQRGDRFSLRLPDDLRGKFAEFGNRTVIEATTSRGQSSRYANTVMIDFGAEFLRYLVACVTAPEFGGGFGLLADAEFDGCLVAAFLTRFQNDQGSPRGDDLVVGVRSADGSIETGSHILGRLFKAPQSTRNDVMNRTERREALERIEDRVELELAALCNRHRHPHSIVAVGILEG